MNRDYRDYINDIVVSVKDIEEFVEGMSYEEFSNDKKTINAVIRSFEIIGEASKKVPPSIRDKYSDIPWKKMSGMRDKMIHEYFGVDITILWKTIKENIPVLKELLNDIEEI